MSSKIVLTLGLLFLTIISWISLTLLLGAGMVPGWLIVLACFWIAAGWVLKPFLRSITSDLGIRILILVGLIVLAVMLLPYSFFDRLIHHPALGSSLGIAIFFLPCIPLVIAAVLLHTGLTLTTTQQATATAEVKDTPEQSRYPSWIAGAVLGLSGLLIAATLYYLYWLTIWDNTDDSIGYIWLIFPVLVTVACGFILAMILPGWRRLAGLYGLALPGLMILVSSRAQSVNFRQLTADRAAQVNQAILAYDSREGHYPQTLQHLVPWYIFPLPGPVIMPGQGWCYQNGSNFYRLGYLDRPHWSSPIRYGHVFTGQGQSPVKTDVCQAEIAAYQRANPGWEQVLQDYGQPTPTPDTGP